MASVVRSVGRHLPGIGSKHSRKDRGTSRDGDGKSPTSSSPLVSNRAGVSGSANSPSARARTSSSDSQAAWSPTGTMAGRGPSASPSTSSVPDAVQLMSSGSSSSSTDCLQPLSDSRLSLERSTGPSELSAAAMDLSKLIAGVERFRIAISGLSKQFTAPREREIRPDPETIGFSDRSEASSDPFEERSIDDAIAAAKPSCRSLPGSDLCPAATNDTRSTGDSPALTPVSPSAILSDSSEWSSPRSSVADGRRLRSNGGTSSQGWATDDEGDGDGATVWMSSPSPDAMADASLQQPNGALVEAVRDVLAAVAALLAEHIAMNGADLFNATKALYELCIEHERLTPGEMPDFPDAVEAVSTAFTGCVADYAFGDRASPDEDLHHLQENLVALSQTVETLENANRLEEASATAAAGSLGPGIPRYFLSEEVPKVLRRWSRYTKELSSFYQKRSQLEMEYSQKLIKLARSTKDTLGALNTQDVPSVNLVQSGLDEDVSYGRDCLENYSMTVAEHVVQPLKELTETLDRVRHDLQSQWQKECRRAEKRKMEALGTMYKARHRYLTSCEEEEKQSQQSNASLNMLRSKVTASQDFYRQAVTAANEAQEQLSAMHSSAFDHINQTATSAGMRCHQCISASISAAQSLWNTRSAGGLTSPVTPPSPKYAEPVSQLQGMVSNTGVYDFEEEAQGGVAMLGKPSPVLRKNARTGSSELLETSSSASEHNAVSPVSPITAWSTAQPTGNDTSATAGSTPSRKRRMTTAGTPEMNRPDTMMFHREASVMKSAPSKKMSAPAQPNGLMEAHSSDSINQKTPSSADAISPLASPYIKPDVQAGGTPSLSRDVQAGGTPSLSRDVQAGGTPSLSRRLMQVQATSSTDSAPNTPKSVRKRSTGEPTRKNSMFHSSNLSSLAKVHDLQRLHGPAKCCHCETYVYFNGAECRQCGIACHRKCLQRLTADCLVPQDANQPGLGKRLKRAMSTFGINMASVVTRSSQDVPAIVPACIKEVEERGLSTLGIYRLSGVKSKVEKLCQQFEKDGGKADIKLSGYPSHLIACVLKLFFRQLPEPLLTYKCYIELIQLGKHGYLGQADDEDHIKQHQQTIQKYQTVMSKLPAQNFYTVKMLMTHLSIVASHSKVNHMTASNLGIVFGPTILQPKIKQGEHNTTVRALVDMPHQSKAVEFLILGVDEIFTPDLEPIQLRKAESAEFLASQSSLGGSLDDLLAAGATDSRASILSELETMCSLLDAVKEQRDIGVAINHGSEPCLPSLQSTTTDGKVLFSTPLPGEIDQVENALNQVKALGAESGIGSVDESDLIQFVKRRQAELEHQAQLRMALHEQHAEPLVKTAKAPADEKAEDPVSPLRTTARNTTGQSPVTPRARKSSLPAMPNQRTYSQMNRSQTRASLMAVKPDDFHRQSTEEVIRQRRQMRDSRSPSQAKPTLCASHVIASDILDVCGDASSFRLDFILDRQDTDANVFDDSYFDDHHSHGALSSFPESASEVCDSDEEDEEPADSLNSETDAVPASTASAPNTVQHDEVKPTTVHSTAPNPLLTTSTPEKHGENERGSDRLGSDKDEDATSVNSLFDSEDESELSALNFLP